MTAMLNVLLVVVESSVQGQIAVPLCASLRVSIESGRAFPPVEVPRKPCEVS